MCSFGCGEPCKNARDSVTMAPKFTPDEEAEIELMLWEYDRDGRIAIDNFFRREPELSLRMAGGIIPKRIQRDLIAFLLGAAELPPNRTGGFR